MVVTFFSRLFFRNQPHWLILVAVLSGVFVVSAAEQQEIPCATVQKPSLATAKPSGSATENIAKPRSEYHPRSVFGKKGEHKLHPIIHQTANRYEVDPALVNAIIMAESEYNARAISSSGARGLMQLMPATAEELGVTDCFNPRQNIDGGVRYFKQLVDQFDGDVILALAAYNAGSRKVRHYRGVPPFKATKLYIKKVFKYYRVYKDRMAVAVG